MYASWRCVRCPARGTGHNACTFPNNGAACLHGQARTPTVREDGHMGSPPEWARKRLAMSDGIKQAFTDAGVQLTPGDTTRSRFRSFTKLDFADDAARKAALEEKAEHLRKLGEFGEFIFLQMEEGVRTLIEFADAQDDKTRAVVRTIKHEMDQETTEPTNKETAEDPQLRSFRIVARAAKSLAVVRYFLTNHLNTITLDDVESIMNRWLLGTLLIADPKGNLKMFGKMYSLPERMQELPEAAKALADLRRLSDTAAANMRRAEREEISEWTASCNITLDELIAGKAGRAQAGVKPERSDRGIRKGGVLFWNSDGVNVALEKAFQGVKGHVERSGIEDQGIPLEVAISETFTYQHRDHRVRNTVKAIWALFRRSVKTATEDASKPRRDRRSRKAEATTPDANAPALVTDAATDTQVNADEVVPAVFPEGTEPEVNATDISDDEPEDDSVDDEEQETDIVLDAQDTATDSLKCKDCEYVADSPRGLSSHRRKHK